MINVTLLLVIRYKYTFYMGKNICILDLGVGDDMILISENVQSILY